MLSSWGGGSKSGSTDYGDYDQCTAGPENKYCLLTIVDNSSTTLGICVPRACTTGELVNWIEPAWNDVQLSLSINCEPEVQESLLPTAAIAVLVLIVVAVVASTTYDAYSRFITKTEPTTVTTTFSLLRNARALFSVSDEKRDLKCVDGIRTLTMVWLVMYHTFRSVEYYTPAKVNPDDLQRWQQSFSYSFIHYAPLAVDTFLLLGGLLVSYKFMQDREKEREFNYLYYVFHRLMRLTPVYASAIVFYMLVFR